jgi:excinuclease ABC subunit C
MSPAKLTQTDFANQLKAAPTKIGVYIMRDRAGTVVYVGKANSLKNRLKSYFSNTVNLTPKIRKMVSLTANFEYIITETETEALILENTLIKRYQPTYNARLKDDKSYPYIKIDLSEEFPLVYITREIPKDGSRYFGPFASAGSVRKTLALLKKLFPYRSCTKSITGTDSRPCLDFHINRCVGPCIGAVDQEGYSEVINQVILFLEGKTELVTRSILKRMQDASNSLQFEKAAILRDQFKSIEKIQEKQKVLSTISENIDVIAAAPHAEESLVEIFFIRAGKLVGRDNFVMTSTKEVEQKSVITSFVQQFYNKNPYVPPTILLQYHIDEKSAIKEWLETKRQGTVKLHVPQRGEKKKLVDMVAENAVQSVKQLKVRNSDLEVSELGMSEIREALSLPSLPRRIECFDISNIQGSNAVGSMVVFQNGKPNPADYRRFKIKEVKGIDDYSMMKEVLRRRFKRLQDSDYVESSSGRKSNLSTLQNRWKEVPNLVIIDGGKGHLSAALQVFLELGTEHIPLASLAKKNEEIFVPQAPEPILLPRNSQGLFLMQNARDEAHRFAITFHRERRSKNSMRSRIDDICGIGPKRKRILLRKFGSLEGIKSASVEEIAEIPTMNIKLANSLKKDL